MCTSAISGKRFLPSLSPPPSPYADYVAGASIQRAIAKSIISEISDARSPSRGEKFGTEPTKKNPDKVELEREPRFAGKTFTDARRQFARRPFAKRSVAISTPRCRNSN